MMMSNILPPEVWNMIFSHLDLTDLNMVMLVSKDLARVAMAGKQWSKVMPSRKKMSMIDMVENINTIKMDRLHNVSLIDIKDYVNDSLDLDEAQERVIYRNVLQYCRTMEHVDELSMESANLVNIGTNLITECIMKLRSLNLRYCQIAPDDLVKILSTIPLSQNLKSIDLSSMDFSSVPPYMLREAARRLDHLYLNHSTLTVEKCMKLLDGVKSNPQMKSLGLGGQQNLKHLPIKMLKNMITPNMRSLELSEINLKPEQLKSILQKMSMIPNLTVIL